MKSRLFLILAFLFSSCVHAQKVKVADKYFRDFAYLKAIELYKDALKREDSTEHILSRIGDCYYNNSNSEQAYFWYHKAVNKHKKIHPQYIYKYIQTLRSLGKYNEANKWLKKFKALQYNDKYAKVFEDISLEKFQELSTPKDLHVRVINLESNSQHSDFGGFEQHGNLYFSSSRVGGKQ